MLRSLRGRARQFIASSLFLYLVIFVILLFILGYHVGSEPNGLSPAELASKNSSQSLSDILNHPINAPHHLLSFMFLKIGLGANRALRLSSILFAELFIICFYNLARSWFGKSIGLFGAAILATTPLFLISARQGSAEIMWFSVITLMSIYAWLLRPSSNKEASIICLAAATGIFIYTPGLVWWLLGALLLSQRRLMEEAAEISKRALGISGLIFILLLVPLVVSIAKDWVIIKSLLLIPAHFNSTVEVLKNVGWMVASVFVKTARNQSLTLDHLPVLDIIQATFLVFGSYALWSAARVKSTVLAGAVMLGIIAAGINNNLSILALSLPALSIFITAGLRYLYIEWRGIFPRNPVAKSTALLLMGLVVIVNILFGLRYSLIAWPHSTATRSSYVLK